MKKLHFILILFLSVGITSFAKAESNGDQPLGAKEYQDTLQAVEKAKNSGQSHKEISDIYLWGAGKCRDLGAQDYVLDLFDAAINEDPTNAVAYRIYGDYLMGYRGLYEDAAAMYYKADEILNKAVPSKESEKKDLQKMKDDLERSFQILRRDGLDGLPIFESEPASFFFQGNVEYRQPISNRDDLLTMFDQQMSAQRFNNPKIVQYKLARRRPEIEYGGELKMRFGPPELPYLRLVGSEVDVDDGGLMNPEDLTHRWEASYRRFLAAIGKNILISDHFDMNVEVGYAKRESRTRDPFRSLIVEVERGDMASLDTSLRYRFATNTLTLATGGDFEKIRTVGSTEDSLNGQRASLRLALYPSADYYAKVEGDNPEKFRGRRTDQFEVGYVRNERKFFNATRLENQLPHVAIDSFGHLKGYLDFSFLYQALGREYSAGYQKGRYSGQEVRFTPTYVPIYKLYDNDFRNGVEQLTVAFPFKMTWVEGPYDTIGQGISVFTSWEIIDGVRLAPTLGFDYARYTQLNKDSWGFSAKLVVSY